MFCEKCGCEVKDNAAFCENCGAQFTPAVMSTSAAVAKKPVPLKYIVIPAVILAVAAIVITVLILVLKPGGNAPAGNITNPGFSQSGNTGNLPGGTSSGIPQQPVTTNTLTLNGTAVQGAEFAYTYDSAYGHYFVVSYTEGSDTMAFMAVLPENLCVSGASYSGNNVSANGIIFDIILASGSDYYEYDSMNHPEVFGNLSVTLYSVNPYQSAQYMISGNVYINGRTTSISASGSSAYKASSTATGTGTVTNNGGYNGANVCGECNGTGYCCICNGSRICTICHGLGRFSVTTYGNGSEYVTCSGCNGTGQCKYCSNGKCGSCGGTGHY